MDFKPISPLCSNQSQQQIISHLQQTDEQRDFSWEDEFLRLFPKTYLTLRSAQPHQGPDGMPYFLADVKVSSKEPAVKLLHWLAERGIGLVIHPEKIYPDYIFTYGMIWHFQQTQVFKVQHNNQMQSPSKTELPASVRLVLKQFFKDQGIYHPKCLMIFIPQSKTIEICFCVESLNNPPASEHQGILKAISWFLPPHYSLAISQKDQIMPFIEL